MSKWDGLSLAEKAEMMKVAIDNGIYNLNDIKAKYNEFAEGGEFNSIPDDWTMKDEAEYQQWRNNLPDNLKNTNDRDYDMRRAYKAGEEPTLESDGYYHLGSRDPYTGRILKAPHHPTYLQAINEDARIGYYPVTREGITYTDTWKGNTFAGGGSTDADLVDWIIREEGFNKKPEDIGDGKMTLGSGLTAKKWHDLYKKRGNKWSATDNRMAVTEEVANRRRWAEKNIPNWDTLPESSQKALLSYKYNYDFTRGNSPKLFAALKAGDLQEAARQMDATSKDPKFQKGLRDRRKREQDWFLSEVTSSTPPIPFIPFEQPVSTFVYNPYVQQQEQTQVLPVMIPDENTYVTTHSISPSEQRRQQIQEAFEARNRFNTLMQMVGVENTAPPLFMPTNNTPLGILSQLTNTNANGGSIHIKPSHRGRLTELKKRTGKTEAELYNDGNPAHKKMVVFARNSRKWKHGEGGPLVEEAMAHYYDGESESTQQIRTHKPYYDVDGTLLYNRTLPETVIIPDSQLSPAERNYRERQRQGNLPDYAEYKDRELTARQVAAAQKEWENSFEKQALDYGQAIASGIGMGADIVSRLPIYSSLKGVSTLNRAEAPIDYVEGGLWLTPILRSAYNTTKPVITQAIDNALAQAQQIGRGTGSPFGFVENIYNYAKRKPIPFAEKQAASQRMNTFIHSPEYIQKQRAAGLTDSEIADFQSMVSRRLNGGNFPAYTMKRKTNGLSLTLPKPFGGIYMREGIPYSDFLNAFDHEVAHYSTVNFGKTDNQLLKLLNRENPTVTEKIMGYNINKVPYRPETDALKVRTARGLDPHTDKLNYYRDEQELRSNAYAVLQEAQRRGISIDELVDQYTMQSTGEIFGHAPAPFRYLNYAYTPENMKKFIKSFLSVSTPVTIGIKTITQNDNE